MIFLGDDVRLFRVHVEEVRLVRRRMAVPQASRTTLVVKPCDMESTQLARTQPEVVSPVRMTLSMPAAVSVEASEVRRTRSDTAW